jgi:hypothetical protein
MDSTCTVDDQRMSTRPLRSALSVDIGDDDVIAGGADGATPLDQRIFQIVRSIPDRTIRPGRLALELGISIEDASAELCGLLASVGGGPNGASFRFESLSASSDSSAPSATTMVFTFPPDFERRALRRRRKEDLKAALLQLLLAAGKVLKIVVAFGLILSLLILTVAAVVGVVAAIVALSRNEGGHRHRSMLWSRIRALFFAVRQLLWCCALFGPTEDQDGGQQDPFFREVAYDLWLFCSVCCGNPGSLFFWMHASQLQRRRNRYLRSWGQSDRDSMESDVPGVQLHRTTTATDSIDVFYNGQPHRSLVSTIVEFLFGPTPFAARPLPPDVWMLRSAALVSLSTRNRAVGVGAIVTLEDIAPYVDYPPDSIVDSTSIVEQGLLIVSYFNGIPVKVDEDCNVVKAAFAFPELLSESLATKRFEYVTDMDDGSWEMFLCAKDDGSVQTTNSISSYLKEERYKFTRLSPKQLTQCVVLGALLPTLKFYAILYFVLPGMRLLLILGLNRIRLCRNTKRARLVSRVLGTKL